MSEFPRKISPGFLVKGRLAAAFIGLMIVFGCGRAPDLIGVDNPDIPVASVTSASKQKIFVMTTRADDEDSAVFYGPKRSTELGLSSMVVSIPPTHETGQIERPKQLPPDPRTEFAVIDPVVYENDTAFISALNRALASRPADQRDVLLFIHGYNNTTSDAVLRLAQFVEDTDYQGVPILFTWASGASAPRYVYDMNSALIARGQIKRIAGIIGRSNAKSGDIFAHSMGTLLTMEAMVEQSLSGNVGEAIDVRHIILASPDIDVNLFRTQLTYLPKQVRDSIFLLVSQDDEALWFSRRIAGGVPRTGALTPEALEPLGITVIDLSDVDDPGTRNHSKFADSPDVVQLIGRGLKQTGDLGLEGRTDLDGLLANSPIRVFRN